jgi:hypothetical protein
MRGRSFLPIPPGTAALQPEKRPAGGWLIGKRLKHENAFPRICSVWISSGKIVPVELILLSHSTIFRRHPGRRMYQSRELRTL